MEVSNQQDAPIYQNCQNELTVNIPFVPASRLILRADTAEASGPSIVLTPDTDTIILEAYEQLADGSERFLRQKTLRTQQPRRPVQITVSDAAGQSYVSGDGVSISERSLEFVVEPDDSFAQTHPADARYVIAEVEVSTRRRNLPSFDLGTFPLSGGTTLSLPLIMRERRLGDLIILRVQSVTRVDSAGRTRVVTLGENSLVFSFVVV